ncbi:virion core protein, T7 gp14 family, partial [Escherichia coli]|uniref:virion core protein, T7 gp14 family n=1 Tax=Escherichia coli TaxID=562 RepID=UPI0015D4D87E
MSALLLSAALTAGSNFLSGMAAKNSAMQQMALQAQWESEQIQRQSLNTMIRNAYNAAFLQMQLSQQKMQRAQYGADIRTAGLAQAGQARLAAASTGSIGA